jgi:hypothetical protein
MLKVIIVFLFALSCSTIEDDSTVAGGPGDSSGVSGATHQQQNTTTFGNVRQFRDAQPIGIELMSVNAVYYERDCAANEMTALGAYDGVMKCLPGGQCVQDLTQTEIEHHDVALEYRYADGTVFMQPIGWGFYYQNDERRLYKNPKNIRVRDIRVLDRREIARVEAAVARLQRKYPVEQYSAVGGIFSGWNCQEMAADLWDLITNRKF